jgi:hypothetical protein
VNREKALKEEKDPEKKKELEDIFGQARAEAS